MNNENKTKGFTLLHKPAKGKMGALIIVFLWIALWNVIYQALHGVLEENGIHIINWSFFAAVTLFFMQEELTYKQRFFHTLIGGAVGLLLAAGIILCYGMLTQMGIEKLIAISIPLVAAIGILILAHPYLPMIFNNVGFIYLIVAFIEKETLVENLHWNILSLVLGSLILNLPCLAFIGVYMKQMKKKAIAAIQKAKN